MRTLRCWPRTRAHACRSVVTGVRPSCCTRRQSAPFCSESHTLTKFESDAMCSTAQDVTRTSLHAHYTPIGSALTQISTHTHAPTDTARRSHKGGTLARPRTRPWESKPGCKPLRADTGTSLCCPARFSKGSFVACCFSSCRCWWVAGLSAGAMRCWATWPMRVCMTCRVSNRAFPLLCEVAVCGEVATIHSCE